MELSLEMKLQQKLSPQMIQSMEILQMGTQELQEYVERTLMENPTLELEPESAPRERSELLRKLEWLNATDRQNRSYHHEAPPDLTDTIPDLESENLYDHLRQQIDMRSLSPRLGIAVDCVLTGLDRNGYLDETTEELALRCGQNIELIVRAEQLIRTLEPAGVAARSLSECLSIQLQRAGHTGLALTIVQNHLEDLAQNHYHIISKKTGASRADIQTACDLIRSLNPRPGSAYAPREAPGYIIPDLLVAEVNGELNIIVGDDFLPVLCVSSYYHSLLIETDDREVRDYLEDKVRQASHLIKSIEQRKSTLLNCAQVIVARQSDFFRGQGHLSPLVLADVANELGIHESTVSRAVKGKYLQCKRGVLPLAHFFSRAVAGNEEGVSSQMVKDAIRSLVDGEDKKHPLSDQKLCDLLAARGISVSRRTIAKYRDELDIPSTQARRQF